MITIYELLAGTEHKAYFLQSADAETARVALDASNPGAPLQLKGNVTSHPVFENEADFWANANIHEVPESAILQIPDQTTRDGLLQARAAQKLTDAEKTALGITP